MFEALSVIRGLGARGRRLVHLEHLPPRPPDFASWPDWSHDQVVGAYRAQGITQPWSHQVDAATALHSGQHTVVATGTGSGKSMAAWLPVLSSILAANAAPSGPGGGSLKALASRPTAIYLSPTKALAADQLNALTQLLDGGGLSQVRAATVDGDANLQERSWAQSWADIVLTNPDFVHFSLLAHHRRWERMLRGLQYVVVDEVHAYRGVFGAHVSLVLRRLLRLAAHFGAYPAVIGLSATSAEPGVSMARLIGASTEEVAVVTADGSPAGDRYVGLWQPPLIEAGGGESEPAAGGSDDDPWATPDDDVFADDEELVSGQDTMVVEAPAVRRSSLAETSDLVAELARGQVRTLAFIRSRAGTEALADTVRRSLRVGGDEATTVAAYRGGYLPEERRELEARLRSGDLMAVASTNALELGVDISGLDAVVICGWPGSRASLWQQAGRAGRAGTEGVAVLVAGADPLDTYLVAHPETVFGQPVEASAFDPANPYVLAPHLCAAAAELPLTEEDFPRFSLEPDYAAQLLGTLEQRGVLRRRPTGWFWNVAQEGRAHDQVQLRDDDGRPISIVLAGDGSVLGTVDAGRADATVFEGAIYVHQGLALRVVQRWEDVALVEVEPAPLRTRAHVDTEVNLIGERQVLPTAEGLTWAFGDVEVISRVTSFITYRIPEAEQVGAERLDSPERILPTTAVWWTLSAEACQDAGVGRDRLAGALHAAEHAMIGLLPLLATCDRWDIGGLSTAVHPQTGSPTVIIHDGYRGGAGFAERGWSMAARWVQATAQILETCPCRDGCPGCVQSPKCGNENHPLDKAGALALLRAVAERLP